MTDILVTKRHLSDSRVLVTVEDRINGKEYAETFPDWDDDGTAAWVAEKVKVLL